MKTRILAIVPYPGMQQILNDIVTQYEDIELTVRISSLEKAVEIARSYAPDELDVIIARRYSRAITKEHGYSRRQNRTYYI